MKVLGGVAGLGHAQVVARAQRQESLEAPARVLGTLTFVAVGQEHHETRTLTPLIFCGDEKVIDDDFGAVDEVAKLRLPGDE